MWFWDVLGCVTGCFGMFWGHVVGLANCPTLQVSAPRCTWAWPSISERSFQVTSLKKMWAPRAPQVLAGTVLTEDTSWRIGMKCTESCWPNISKLYPNRSEYKYIATLCSTQCITLRHETIRRYEPFVDWIGIDHHRSMEVQSAQFH